LTGFLKRDRTRDEYIINYASNSDFSICFGLSTVPDFYFPGTRIIPSNFKIIGLFVMFIALIFIIDSYWRFSRHNTTMVYGEKASHLMTDGTFAFTRNPLYLSLTVLLIGLVIFMGNLLAFIGPIILVICLNKFVIPNEERNLEIIFGNKYKSYKKKSVAMALIAFITLHINL